MSDSELITVAWPEIQNYFRAENIKVTERLDVAFGNKTYAGGFDEVIEMAQLGRVAYVVISDEVTSNPLTETAVRLTLQSGGEVSFVPAADLTKFAEICADLRF
jgi:stalled ribosome rescue protein Dom34